MVFEAKKWTTLKKKKQQQQHQQWYEKKNVRRNLTFFMVRYDMFVSRQGWAQWRYARWRRIQEGSASARCLSQDFLRLGSALEAKTLVRILSLHKLFLEKEQKECFSGPYFSFNWLVDINLF